MFVGSFAFILCAMQAVFAQDDVDPSFFSSDPIWLEDSTIDPNCEVT